MLLGRLNRRFRVAFLVISHDIKMLARLADRVMVMYAGRIVEQGPCQAILYEPLHSYTGEMKTADLPIAGPFYSTHTLGLIFQFVNLANDVPTKAPASRVEAERMVPVDDNGKGTIEFLRRTQRVASLLSNLRTTNYSHSVDLHPFVYFYSRNGNQKNNAPTHHACNSGKGNKQKPAMKTVTVK